MIVTVYRIRNWNEHFENSRSREVKSLAYVPLPNKHDGEGYSILMTEHEDGALHYAAWVLMVQVASKCEPRGVLCRTDGSPLDARALGVKTRAPKEIFEAAIPRLIEIGWLEVVPTPQETATSPQQSADVLPTICRRPADVPPILGKGREQKRREEEVAAPAATKPSPEPIAAATPESPADERPERPREDPPVAVSPDPAAPAVERTKPKPTREPPHRIAATMAAWDRVFADVTRRAYLRTNPKAEAARVKAFLAEADKAGITDQQIEAAMRRFCADPWGAGKALVVFLGAANEFLADKPPQRSGVVRGTASDPLLQRTDLDGYVASKLKGSAQPVATLPGADDEAARGRREIVSVDRSA